MRVRRDVGMAVGMDVIMESCKQEGRCGSRHRQDLDIYNYVYEGSINVDVKAKVT